MMLRTIRHRYEMDTVANSAIATTASKRNSGVSTLRVDSLYDATGPTVSSQRKVKFPPLGVESPYNIVAPAMLTRDEATKTMSAILNAQRVFNASQPSFHNEWSAIMFSAARAKSLNQHPTILAHISFGCQHSYRGRKFTNWCERMIDGTAFLLSCCPYVYI